MKKYLIICLFIFFAYISFSANVYDKYYPENWIPPEKRINNPVEFGKDLFIQDFSYAGYHKGEKPLPSIDINNFDGKIFDVACEQKYKEKVDENDDWTKAIQLAINDAGAYAKKHKKRAVVYLKNGTYKISPKKNKKYCILIQYDNVILCGESKE